MSRTNQRTERRIRRARAGRIAEPVAWTLAAVVVVASAIVTKEAGSVPSMVSVDEHTASHAEMDPAQSLLMESARPDSQLVLASRSTSVSDFAEDSNDSEIRWFDGRPIRPARTIYMKVTAYSPDRASCGPYADGKTATLHSIWTNAMQLVAADPKVLPYGSMITVPGYASGEVVPVLDCGAAIKGNRLDVLYATHARARQWGVRELPITIWEYADGKPAPNPRKLR